VRRRVSLPDVALYLRGRLNMGLSRALNARDRTPRVAPPPVDEVIHGGRTPLALSRLLEGRSNPEREAAVARYLNARGVPFALHQFASPEGTGENFSVDLGSGRRVLVLVAHHDAVPGSPGANDNAAAVGLLLNLLERLAASPPSKVRVRVLFTAAEERGYLGARHYARAANLDELAGVLSLELCGIGDSVAIWDAPYGTPFLTQVCAALAGAGLRRDESYHVVGRIPLFGSDHRAFAPAGVPAYGFTMVPSREAEALRRFVFSPVRSAFRHLIRRPIPFDTYHTTRDRGGTLEPAALAVALKALDAVIAEVE
jgi:Zn-dependent M28 family amino/carboxypeptidase